MAKYIIARQLSGRRVITNEGEEFGKLVDVSINELDGTVEHLVVDPNPDSPVASKMKKEDGLVNVPYESVLAAGDFIIIDKKHLLYE